MTHMQRPSPRLSPSVVEEEVGEVVEELLMGSQPTMMPESAISSSSLENINHFECVIFERPFGP